LIEYHPVSFSIITKKPDCKTVGLFGYPHAGNFGKVYVGVNFVIFMVNLKHDTVRESGPILKFFQILVWKKLVNVMQVILQFCNSENSGLDKKIWFDL
jgi:hypothetical protein